jgi:DNA-binding transcriptional ArsR family regulator
MTETAKNREDALLVPSEDDIEIASRSIKAMAHPLRLKILCILGTTSEFSVHDIVEQVGTSQSNVSQHISVLRDEEAILTSRKDGNKGR